MCAESNPGSGESPRQRIEGARQRPGSFQRFVNRMPIWFYHLGLGWLFGRRFLLLHHVGRNSGQPRETVLEVTGYDPATDTYLIASGWGIAADWYRNLRHTPDARIQVATRRLAVRAEALSPEDSGRSMADYARRHPSAAKALARLFGWEVKGAPTDYFALGRDAVPFVALHVVK